MPDNWWDAYVSEKILIKNGQIVNADSRQVGDVLIERGKIIKVAKVIEPEAEDMFMINAENMYIFPGGIDPSTHFEYDFMKTRTIDDFFNGTRAAVRGGTTTIMDFIVPKVGEDLESAYKSRRRQADSEVVCDYSLHMTLTSWNEDIKREMGQVALVCGINSFMMYMSYKDLYLLNDSELYQACLCCRKLGALPMILAENGEIIDENEKRLIENGVTGIEGHYLARPDILQVEAINRACVIASQVKCPLYFCNIMNVNAAETVRSYKTQGYTIFAETLAAALGSTKPKSAITCFRDASSFVTSPPISGNKDCPVNLMRRLERNELNTTASNHCTYTADQKETGKSSFKKIPHGINGVEERMAVIWEKGVNTGILSLSQFVAVTSTNAAKLFNLYPKKGIIKEGSDADIVIWNPGKLRRISRHTHQHAGDFNIFDGMQTYGSPEYVFVKGKLCFDGNICRVHRGFGKYVYRECFSDEVYSTKNIRELQQDNFGLGHL